MSTDIIEQAKHHNWWYSDTNLATLLIHEVERLRRDHEKTWADAQLKAAEIEQLRELCAESLAALNSTEDTCLTFAALRQRLEWEIERLRTALVADDEGRVAYQNGFHARDAEVESLRKELEREKQEHDRCTTFHAIAVKERNYERVLALQRDAEIKRLHGEMELMRLMDEPTLSAIEKRDNEIERLREVIRDLDAHEGAEGWSQDLRQRVRKALGE